MEVLLLVVWQKKGKEVLVVERRSEIGGNLYDEKDKTGILVQKYGPHIFHTNDEEVYSFINKYAKWKPFKLRCEVDMLGKSTPSPFNFKTIDQFYPADKAEELKKHLKEAYPDRLTVTIVELIESTDSLIKEYAEFLFKNDYSLYTAKQWGMSPSEIDPSVLKRVPLRLSYKDGYFDDEYQILPLTTYEDFFKNILNHPKIKVRLGVEALDHLLLDEDNKRVLVDGDDSYYVIFTGALDELFGCRYGKLPYRSLHFDWKYEDKDSFQGAPLVAYPQEEGYTRIVEYKKLPPQDVKGTSYAIEYPLPYINGADVEPYYPVLTSESNELYMKYVECANNYSNLYFCGRLANFKYYNMDEALRNALHFINDVMSNE